MILTPEVVGQNQEAMGNAPQSSQQPRRENTMEEKTFFEYDDVKVTNSRFITGSQTFAMSNVTSVKALTEKPKRLGGILVLVVGLAIAANSEFAVGGAIAAVAALYLYLQKTTYHVMLNTSGGETSALKTFQKEYISKVVAALNEAIVHRG